MTHACNKLTIPVRALHPNRHSTTLVDRGIDRLCVRGGLLHDAAVSQSAACKTRQLA
jgi:hypothetical protein